jgi:N6-L-threonylcarbamoyladenine synthase
MKVLAIETSCDETAVAIVQWSNHRFTILSNIVASQAAKHALFGGVVPELATREHLNALEGVTQLALDQAHISWDQLDGIAATRGPGLASALLMGHSFAKSLALAKDLPFVGVNHLEGHLVSPFLSDEAPSLGKVKRWLTLLVSGGHTLLVLTELGNPYEILGATRDDAAGEAFDKGAKLLGLGYPGGPELEKMSRSGDETAYDFPRGMQHSGDLNFSFSGLKTALRIVLEKKFSSSPCEQDLFDLCASYQAAIVEALAIKTEAALEKTQCQHLTLAGGVACNQRLRQKMEKLCQKKQVSLWIVPSVLCTDNAAMIGAAACLRLERGEVSPLIEEIDPNLKLVA